MLIHYLYAFFINIFTVPKVRDLIQNPMERYNNIISTPNIQLDTDVDDILTTANDTMQYELRDFINNIKTGNVKAEVAGSPPNDMSNYSTF